MKSASLLPAWSVSDHPERGPRATPASRQDFKLLPDDRHFLNSLGLRWEAVLEGGSCAWSSTIGRRRMAGYNVDAADVHVRMTAVTPTFKSTWRTSRRLSPGATVASTGCPAFQFDGRQWQRWSRHRTANSPWRIGEDGLLTHTQYVYAWLEAELRK